MQSITQSIQIQKVYSLPVSVFIVFYTKRLKQMGLYVKSNVSIRKIDLIKMQSLLCLYSSAMKMKLTGKIQEFNISLRFDVENRRYKQERIGPIREAWTIFRKTSRLLRFTRLH